MQALAAQARGSEHPDLLTLDATYEDEASVYLLRELCQGTRLFSTAEVQDGYAEPEPVVKKQALQLLSAIDYCHKQGMLLFSV